ncbi:hypothetical protein TruAng_009059 [Truncatella angustata]|nr:hypothetical protein TruAng_009059 [Truncatella angustata]
METPGKYLSQRAPGREHLPLYPKGFIAIRIVQLVLAVVVLGLTAYGVSQLAFDGDILSLFSALATLITCIYIIVAEFGAPALYNYWAVLSLDIFLVVFWLISFALLAAEIAPYASGYCTYYYCYSLSSAEKTYFAILAAAAGLGGAEFLAFLVSLVIHSVMLHRHRNAGLHCNPITSTSQPNPAVASATVLASAEKPVEYSQGQPYPLQNLPAKGYTQQSNTVQNQSQAYPQQPYASSQQQYYPHQVPQQTPSPLSAQVTGGAVQQSGVENTRKDAESTYGHGAPENTQGPYETSGQPVQRPAQ